MIIPLLQNAKHLVQTVFVSLVDAVAVRKGPRKSKTLLLVHLDAIGDYILFRNFISLLKKSPRYEGYSITLCGNIAYRDLAETLDRDVVDKFIWVDRMKLRYNPSYRYCVMRDISDRGFEVAIHPAYSRVYYWGDSIVKASCAAEKIGSSGDGTNIKPWQKRLSDRFYTQLIPADGGIVFEFFRNRRFFEILLGTHLQLAKPVLDVSNIELHQPLPGPYAVLFPGAADNFRQWSPENFAKLADYLAERHRLYIVLAGSHGEKSLAVRVAGLARTKCVTDLTGETTLPELTKLIADAHVLVSNETSAVHMAVAVGTKVVCISNGNHLGRFCPYPAETEADARYVFPEAIGEGADFHAMCENYRIKSPLHINSITVDEVKSVLDTVV